MLVYFNLNVLTPISLPTKILVLEYWHAVNCQYSNVKIVTAAPLPSYNNMEYC